MRTKTAVSGEAREPWEGDPETWKETPAPELPVWLVVEDFLENLAVEERAKRREAPHA